MKKAFFIVIILLNILSIKSTAQNVGISNADPKVALDVQGGIATRAVTIAPAAGNAVNIPANASLVVISGGSATATINGLYASAYVDGQRMIIYNTNAAGYDVLFFGTAIPLNQAREFICRSPGGWSLLSGALNAEGWSLKGNAGTDTGANFIGTTDNQPLVLKINNERAGFIDGIKNTAIGHLAMPSASIDAAENTAVGGKALNRLFAGGKNTAIGLSAAERLKTGEMNLAIGPFALALDTAGSESVAVGPYALAYNQNREGNTAVGTFALVSNALTNTSPILPAQGLQNTALGHSALYSSRRGSGSVAIGYKAAYGDTAADGIIAIGRAALYHNNAFGNVAIGDSALFFNSYGVASNIAVGNTAAGEKALLQNTSGLYNTAMGIWALRNNSTGNSNTAIGALSSFANSTGIYNTAIGANALMLNRFSKRNVAIGNDALKNYNTINVDEAGNNVAVGAYALSDLIQGTENVSLGSFALINNQRSGNTAVGFEAGRSNFYGARNVFIGRKAGENSKSSDKLYIENGQNFTNDSTNALIYGDFANDSLLLNAKTVVRNNAVVRGYTQLGGYEADVPSIKMKKLTVTNGASGAVTPFLHGLAQSKILSVTVLINANTGNFIPPRSTYAGFEYDYYVGFSSIFIKNIAGNDAAIAGRPIKILITYEE